MPSIDAIEGIGHRNATKLRKNRIRTTEALLKRGATRSGRREVSGATGFSEKQILEWVNRADLMRCKGVGSEYSDLLEAAGVDTIWVTYEPTETGTVSATLTIMSNDSLHEALTVAVLATAK